MDRDRFQLPTWRIDKSIVWQRHLSSEDVEHKGYALKTEHIIAVCRDLNLELCGLLLAIDNWAFGIGGVFVEFNTEVEAKHLKFFSGVSRNSLASSFENFQNQDITYHTLGPEL
jgi:hypothetical protein